MPPAGPAAAARVPAVAAATAPSKVADSAALALARAEASLALTDGATSQRRSRRR